MVQTSRRSHTRRRDLQQQKLGKQSRPNWMLYSPLISTTVEIRKIVQTKLDALFSTDIYNSRNQEDSLDNGGQIRHGLLSTTVEIRKIVQPHCIAPQATVIYNSRNQEDSLDRLNIHKTPSIYNSRNQEDSLDTHERPKGLVNLQQQKLGRQSRHSRKTKRIG